MNKIIVVLGPTAVGKTKLSIQLAKYYDGEIINADSMQFYKGLDIGTAKVKENEKENIKHHLFDILDVSENYSIYNYQKDGRRKIEEIKSRNKNVIIVGGTGLYIKALLYDYNLNEEKINDTYEDISTDDLYNRLLELDKDTKVDKNNRVRIIRAINYYLENNNSISNNKTDKLLYDVIFIGLTTDRKDLYDKINNRVDEMIKEGLLEEVKYFYDNKIYTKPLINGIGYKELYSYFDKKISMDEAICLIKKNSRRYAKRQFTFFKNQISNIKWFDTDYDNFENTVDSVIEYIDKKIN